MIQKIGSEIGNKVLSQEFERFIDSLPDVEGFYYRGFPIISTYDSGVKLDGLLCAESYGVVIVHVYEEQEIRPSFIEMVDAVHLKIISLLSEVKSLMRKRQLSVPIKTVIYAPRLIDDAFDFEEDDVFLIQSQGEFLTAVHDEEWIGDANVRTVLSRLQSLSNLRTTKKRVNVKKDGSKGDTLKRLELDLATLNNRSEM